MPQLAVSEITLAQTSGSKPKENVMRSKNTHNSYWNSTNIDRRGKRLQSLRKRQVRSAVIWRASIPNLHLNWVNRPWQPIYPRQNLEETVTFHSNRICLPTILKAGQPAPSKTNKWSTSKKTFRSLNNANSGLKNKIFPTFSSYLEPISCHEPFQKLPNKNLIKALKRPDRKSTCFWRKNAIYISKR